MADSKRMRDEVAALTDAVHELRAEVEKLRAERAGHHCPYCWHGYVWQPTIWGGVTTMGAAPVPGTVIVNTAGSNYTPCVAGTNVAAGPQPAQTMLVNTLS